MPIKKIIPGQKIRLILIAKLQRESWVFLKRPVTYIRMEYLYSIFVYVCGVENVCMCYTVVVHGCVKLIELFDPYIISHDAV